VIGMVRWRAGATALVVIVATSGCAVLERSSLTSAGTQLTSGRVTGAALSTDGRFALMTATDPLVPEDHDGVPDAYVHDHKEGRVERASVGPGGAEPNGASTAIDISSDGRFVLFSSAATNLVSPAPAGALNYFVRDRSAGTTTVALVTTDHGPLDAPIDHAVLSGDGRFVVVGTKAGNVLPGDGSASADVLVVDRTTGAVERANVNSAGVASNLGADTPSVSHDGRFVVFHSEASNLVPGIESGSVFVRDRDAYTVQTVVIDGDGDAVDLGASVGDGKAISDNGRFVVFEGPVELLPHHPYVGSSNYVRDLVAGTTRDIDILPAPPRRSASFLTYGISDDGRFVLGSALEYSTNRADPFVYVADMARREMTLISVAKDGTVPRRLSTPVGMSGDGKVVLFDSNSDTLLVPDANGTRSDTYRSTRVPLPPPG